MTCSSSIWGGRRGTALASPRRLPSCQSSQPRRILAFRTAPPKKVLTPPPPVRHTAPTWGNDGEGRETHHLLKAFHSPRRDARPKTAHQREGQVHRPSAVGKWKRGKGGNDPPSSFPLTRHVEDPWWRSPKNIAAWGGPIMSLLVPDADTHAPSAAPQLRRPLFAPSESRRAKSGRASVDRTDAGRLGRLGKGLSLDQQGAKSHPGEHDKPVRGRPPVSVLGNENVT